MSQNNALHFVHNLDNSYGGPARSIPELMHAMTNFGWRSSALSLSFGSGEANELIEKYEIPWKTLRAQGHPSLAFNASLNREISNIRPNLIHYHNIWNYVPLAASRAGRQNDCPVVMSPRGTLFPWNLKKGSLKKSCYLAWFGALLFQRSAAIHATSDAEVEAVKKISKNTPVALIANGVDTSEFSHLSQKIVHKSNLGLNTSNRHILYVGRIEEKKGLAILITALSKLRKSGFQGELLVAGPNYSEEYAAYCHLLSEELGVSDAIKWLGMVSGESRRDIYGASDLFVLPTHTENFGMAIAEALSASLPVVTTRGTPWAVIKEKEAGYVIDPDVGQLSNALHHFFGLAPGSVLKMSIAAREVSELYGWEGPAEQMSHLYDWLLGRVGRPDFVY